MYEGGPNPTSIQFAPAGEVARAPLVLIHDGGGTTFSYFALGPLDREVHGIHNPHYWSNQAFDGGVDEMARRYIDLLLAAGVRGEVILGGWSFAGYISLAMAALLARDPRARIKVVGIVMMDTPWHEPRENVVGAIDNPSFPHLPVQVNRAFKRCDEMLLRWPLPAWDAPACQKPVSLELEGGTVTFKPGQALRRPVDGEWEVIDTKSPRAETSSRRPIAPPPCVLIRCVGRVELPPGREERYLIDRHRGERMLGWEGRHVEFIKAVMDFDSDHYHMFDAEPREKMEELTDLLSEALEILDGIAQA